MFAIFTIGPLRVLVNEATGEVTSVQDSLTGCAASLMYSNRDIAEASRRALLAFDSLFSEA